MHDDEVVDGREERRQAALILRQERLPAHLPAYVVAHLVQNHLYEGFLHDGAVGRQQTSLLCHGLQVIGRHLDQRTQLQRLRS